MTTDLKLGLALGYWSSGMPEGFVELVQEAERLGYDSAWSAEAYGSDAFTPLAYLAAHTKTIKLGTGIVQLSARTPTAVAMTAITLDHLSGGRFILGLGVSGPQVVEGWYGQPFGKPLARTREYIGIIRSVVRRDGPVTAPGPHYPLPYPSGTGLGKPLKSIVHPFRTEIPIYLAAEGTKNVQLATEVADGWLPMFYSPYKSEVFEESLRKAPEGFEIPCVVTTMVTDDVAAGLAAVKFFLALYIGGMGAREMNFHFDIVGRLGYAAEAENVQQLYLDGKRAEAVAAVPDDLADEISLIGPPSRIRERLEAWVKSPITQVIAGTRDPAALKVLADALG